MALRGKIVDSIYKFARFAALCTTVVLVAYFVRDCVVALAGRDTNFSASSTFKFLLDVNKWAGTAAAAIFGVAFVRERSLRKRTIAGKSDYVRQLEEKIDPGRSRSGLTRTGAPRKEDEDD